jgi:preprotein translocase subunit SecG
MSLFIGFLTAVLVVDCLLLILLVLIQLPKKEAGAGLAFGGGATDALFGAGSGNALTKITKYASITFFVLLILISVLQTSQRHAPTTDFLQGIEAQNKAATLPPAASPTAAPAVVPASNAPALQLFTTTNAVAPAAAAATNAAPK